VKLTPLELAVLRAAAAGRTARETGAELHYAPAYVKHVRARILVELQVSNMAAAVWKARGEL
jgi:DNA-binding NarL/FixJ family response regulator